MTGTSRWIWLILAAAPLLTAALWMDDQPSYRAYKAPILLAPAGSVPVSGRETTGKEAGKQNPLPSSAATVAQGKALFEINCAMCHGPTSSKPGPVGQKLTPPPPGLGRDMVQGLSDQDIFKALTNGFGRMPTFRDKLTVLERWSLINYLRTRD
jgi:mono/diheme cytochrome c family protein